jgi:hypothetical protein
MGFLFRIVALAFFSAGLIYDNKKNNKKVIIV